jgi:hypothetical protein
VRDEEIIPVFGRSHGSRHIRHVCCAVLDRHRKSRPVEAVTRPIPWRQAVAGQARYEKGAGPAQRRRSMSPYIIIAWAFSAFLSITTLMNGGDSSAYVAAMITIAAIGGRGKV